LLTHGAKSVAVDNGGITADLVTSTNYQGSNVVGAVALAQSATSAASLSGLVQKTNFAQGLFTTLIPPINVIRDFGAPNDGVTPAQVQFQTAINFAISNSISDIYVPAGTYLIQPTSTNFLGGFNWDVNCLNLPMTNGVKLHFMGDGNATLLLTNSSIVAASGTNDSYTTMFHSSGAGADLSFQGLIFKANVGPDPASKVTAVFVGIDLANTTNVTFRDCWWYNWGYCGYDNASENLTINGNHVFYSSGRNCEINDGGNAPAVGFRHYKVFNLEAHDNVWLGSDITNYTTQAAGLVWKAPMDGFIWGTSVRCNISRNVIRRNGVEAIFVEGREPDSIYGDWSSGAQPGSHIVADNIIEGDPQTGQAGIPYVGISYNDTEATIQGNRIKDCFFGVHLQWKYQAGYITNRSGITIQGNRIQLPSLSKWGSIFNTTFPSYGIDVYGYTNVVIQNNTIRFPDRGVPAWATNGAMPYAGISLQGCYGSKVSANTVISTVPYASAADYPTNAIQIFGTWIAFACTNTIVGRNTYDGLDAGLVTWSEPSWRLSNMQVSEEQDNRNVLYPHATRGTWGSVAPGASTLDSHSHYPTYQRRESTEFYAALPGWYRVIIAETNGSAPRFDVAGKLSISADPTNQANSDHMTYYVNANSPGTASELTRVSSSSLTSGGALLGGARISSAGYPPAIAQVDVLTLASNTIVDLWWESDHPDRSHLLSVPFLVPPGDERVFEVSDTNVTPYSASYSRPGRPFTYNQSWLEMVPWTNSGINPQSTGLSIGVDTNGASGKMRLLSQDPQSARLVIFDAAQGGVVQSNSLSEILAGTLTNGGFATNIIYPIESATVGMITNGQTVQPFIKPASIDTNLLSASAWAWLNTLGNSNATWINSSNLVWQSTNGLTTGAFTPSNTAWVNASNLVWQGSNALSSGAFTSSNTLWLSASNLAKLSLSTADGWFALSSNGVYVASRNGFAISNIQTGSLVGSVPPSSMGTNVYLIAGNANVTIVTNYSGGVYSYSISVGTGGTVTSVGLTAPNIFSVSGSPVTGSGSLTLTFTTQLANTFFKGPNSGGAALPVFGLIVPADLASADAITNGQTTVVSLKGGGLTVTNSATGSFVRILNDSILSSNAVTGNLFYQTNDSVQITNRLTGHQAVITNGTFYGLGNNLTNSSGGGANGTVTSVSASGPPWLSFAGVPITGSGTITITNTAGVSATNFNSGAFWTNANTGAWFYLGTNAHLYAVDQFGDILSSGTNWFAYARTNGTGFGFTNDTFYLASNIMVQGSMTMGQLLLSQIIATNLSGNTLVVSNSLYVGTNTLGLSNVFQVDSIYRTNAFAVSTNGDVRVNQTMTSSGITNSALLSADAVATDANGKEIAATAIAEAHVSGLVGDLSQKVLTNDSRNLVLNSSSNNGRSSVRHPVPDAAGRCCWSAGRPSRRTPAPSC